MINLLDKSLNIEELHKQQRERLIAPQNKLEVKPVSKYYETARLAGMVADTSACGFYRVVFPMHYMAMHGAYTHTSSLYEFSRLIDKDLIVVPRQHSPEVYEFVRQLGFEGKTLVGELDDNLDCVLDTSPAYATYHPGSAENKMVGKILRYCHGMTTTTSEIAKWYYQYNRNITIVENYIDMALRDWSVDVLWDGVNPLFKPKPIPRPPEWEGKIVIGYSGGQTHQTDLEQIGHTLKPILDKYDNVIFAMNASIEMAIKFAQQYDLHPDKVHFVPAAHFLDHPNCLNGFDISLAPIYGCEFNLAKSHLKILESMAKGAAVIASHVGPYAKFESRHPDSFLTVGRGVRSHSTWGSALRYLIENPDKLREMKIQGRQLILDKYTMDQNFHKWVAAWQLIAAKGRAGEIGPPEKIKPKGEYFSWGKASRNDPCPCGSGIPYKKCCKEAFG